MLRACELAGRLGFRIEDDAQRAIRRWRGDMAKASPARLVEELLEILRSGHAGRTFQWMLDLGLAETLLPELEAMIEAEVEGLGAFGRILPVLDRVVGGVRDASDSLLLSCLLAPAVLLERHDREESRRRPLARAEVRSVIEHRDRSSGRALQPLARARQADAGHARAVPAAVRAAADGLDRPPRHQSSAVCTRRCCCSRCSPTPPARVTRCSRPGGWRRSRRATLRPSPARASAVAAVVAERAAVRGPNRRSSASTRSTDRSSDRPRAP